MTAANRGHLPQDTRESADQATLPANADQDSALPTRAQGEMAIALFNAGRLDEANAAAIALIEQFPAHPLGWKVRAISLYQLGQHLASEPYLRHAHELLPNDPDVLQGYVALLEAKADHTDAERLCRKLLEVAPGHAEGTRLLGVILMATDREREAERYLLQAAQLAPDSALIWNSLGSLYLRQGRIEEATRQFLHSLDHNSGDAATWSNLLFCVTHSEDVEPDALFAAHCGFAEPFEAPHKPHWPRHANSHEPERVLRIGFVSADLKRHPVANFIEPVLPHLARDTSLRLYAYSNTVRPDAITERLRGHFAQWRDVSDMDDAALVRQIENDGIDILIDLSGHTGYNRLPAFARKPAPVQASWIGYPGTTGLTAIDYFLADRCWTPSAQFEAQFTEKIVYLPAVAPFLPEQDEPPLNELPALRNGYVTFGSFNRVSKLQRNVVALWARLLRSMPTARLKIAAMPPDGALDAQLVQWFAEEGIERERLDFHPRMAVAEFLRLHHEVDIALDTFPFGGLTTALQSLWMGVPTLTLPGRTVPGRSGATVMGHAGLDCFVASDAEDFERRGKALAADLPALAEMRAGIRERCAASPMFQADAIARGVSRALRTMWRRWCAGEQPQSFDVSEESAAESSASHAAPAAVTESPRAAGGVDHQPTKNYVHQIFYSSTTRAKLDPGFIPLDNTGQRPDWCEYWPIRRFLLENKLDPDARYGFLSPKFLDKTGLTAGQVMQFLDTKAKQRHRAPDARTQAATIQSHEASTAPKPSQIPGTVQLPKLGALPMDRIISYTHDQSWGISNPKRFKELMDEARTLVAEGYYLGDNMFVWTRNNSWAEDKPFLQAWQANALNAADGAIVWRRYILGCAAFHGIQLEGDFVECGVYQGTGIKTVLDYLGGTAFPRIFWGYDTFDYNPVAGHAFDGQAAGFHENVCRRFADYGQVKLIKGLIPESFSQGMPEKIAYLHIDLNNVDGEIAALDALFDRVVPGGMIIMDDYEWSGVYRVQKEAEDRWFDARGYRVFPLPTGQGLIFKR